MANAQKVRDAMLAAADTTLAILESPEVARRWDESSAVRGFSVGGLAAHVTTVLASCHRCIDDPEVDDPPIAAEDYYAIFELTQQDSEANATIVRHGEERARHGADATARRFRGLLEELKEKLDGVPPDRTVKIFGLVPMRLDDFFLTRTLEFCVHSDDLAASIGVEAHLDQASIDLVLHHLVATARRRHGDIAVLRALTRQERDEVSALRVF